MSAVQAGTGPMLLAAAAGVGGLLAAVALVALVRTVRTSEHVEMLLTALVAGIATAGALQGMWQVFTVALHVEAATAAFLCGAFELSMLVSALRARRSLIKHGKVGADGVAVWAFATVSAVIAAAEQPGVVGRCVRLALPFVAAWLWERSLAAKRRDLAERKAVAWRLTPRRVAVWLRLADPSERDAGDVDRARRLAAMARQRLRIDAMETRQVPTLVAFLTARRTRLAVARWRWDRQKLAAVTHLGLGQEARVAGVIRDVVAAVVRLEAATSPAALAAAPPRLAASTPRQDRQRTATEAPQVSTPPATDGGAVAVAGPPLAGTVVAGPMAVVGSEVADMSVADQVAWFTRQLPRHPGRTAAEWSERTGLSKRTVERRISAARGPAENEAVAR